MPPLPSLEQLLALADEAPDVDMLEREIVTPFELDAKRVIDRVLQGSAVRHRHRLLMMNYLAFCALRTSGWLTNYMPPLVRRTRELVELKALRDGAAPAMFNEPIVAACMAAYNACSFLFQIVDMFHGRFVRLPPILAQLGLNAIDIVVASGSTKFILTDHPGRALGFTFAGMPTRAIVMPISPDVSLLASVRRGEVCLRRAIDDHFVRVVNTKLLEFAFMGAVLPGPSLDLFVPGFEPLESRPFSEDVEPLFAKFVPPEG